MGVSKKEKRRLKESRRRALDCGSDGVIFTRRDEPASGFRGMYAGGAVFVVCGGPSAAKQDLSILEQRGIVVAAVNHAATLVRPHIWITVDTQTQFCAGLWRDPSIMKFAKRKYLGKFIHDWNEQAGMYTETSLQPRDLANCWGFEHTDFGKQPYDPATFLTAPLPAWGSSDSTNDPDLTQRHMTVMLPLFWLLNYLGFRRVYLTGCDFKMKVDNPYAFDEKTTDGKAAGNNALYEWMNRRFAEMQPHWLNRGFAVHNCTDGGKLGTFPRISLSDAVNLESALVPPTRTAGHYRA